MRNAIPREAFSAIVFDKNVIGRLKELIDNFHTAIKEEFGTIEKDLKISVKDALLPRYVMDKESQTRLIDSLTACPHGVIAWSKEMEDLV